MGLLLEKFKLYWYEFYLKDLEKKVSGLLLKELKVKNKISSVRVRVKKLEEDELK